MSGKIKLFICLICSNSVAFCRNIFFRALHYNNLFLLTEVGDTPSPLLWERAQSLKKKAWVNRES